MKTFTLVVALCLALAISANAQGCAINVQDVSGLDLKPVKPACGKKSQIFETSTTTVSLAWEFPRALLS
jgi:hypothetical protein